MRQFQIYQGSLIGRLIDYIEPPQSEKIKTNNTMKYRRKYINTE